MAPRKPKTPTGTRQTAARTASPRIRPKQFTVKSKESDSTTASGWDAWKPTPVTRPSTRSGSSFAKQNELPVSPKVTIGPKAYEMWENGAVKVIRFYVGLTFYSRKGKFWFHEPFQVYDSDTGKVAAKTSKTGYATKKEAVRVAREYRDKYGAYAKVPF